jgi:hypothetical protein
MSPSRIRNVVVLAAPFGPKAVDLTRADSEIDSVDRRDLAVSFDESSRLDGSAVHGREATDEKNALPEP